VNHRIRLLPTAVPAWADPAALLSGRERDTRICGHRVATCVDIARKTGHRRH